MDLLLVQTLQHQVLKVILFLSSSSLKKLIWGLKFDY